MAANTLQDTINLITPFCRYQAANIGVSNQPIVGIASIVNNIILSAPFSWEFNRATDSSITTTIGQQDYTATLPTFGYLEKATVQNAAGQIWEIDDIRNNEPLGVSNIQARPTTIAVQSDNGSGVYTFRFGGVPNAAYTVNLIYQQDPVKFTSTTQPWAPIPDSFADVYSNLCLGYYMDSCQDGRADKYIARGIAGLLARAQGLEQIDKALFAQSYMQFGSAEILANLKTQQGQQAQGAR